MKITEKLCARTRNMAGSEPVSIAFLGDSVTQGCFEVYELGGGALETVYDADNGYAAKTVSLLRKLYPNAQINCIPAGISGDSAPGCLARLERDVLRYHPDVVVLSCGLNDCGGGADRLGVYTDAIREIFRRVRAAGSEGIFLSSNPLSPHVSPRVGAELFRNIAANFAQLSAAGVDTLYMEAGMQAAREGGAAVCDCFHLWKSMEAAGVDITELMANRLNHPDREMHWLFAMELVKTILTL